MLNIKIIIFLWAKRNKAFNETFLSFIKLNWIKFIIKFEWKCVTNEKKKIANIILNELSKQFFELQPPRVHVSFYLWIRS